jgi:hypothetical protein
LTLDGFMEMEIATVNSQQLTVSTAEQDSGTEAAA